MQLSLFPQEFCLSLSKDEGLLAKPLKIVQKLLSCSSSNEVLNRIRWDQQQVSNKRAKNRGTTKTTSTNRHMMAELVLVFCTVRGFLPDIYGDRGYQLLKESYSLRQVLGDFAITSFPGRSTIHDQITGLSQETLDSFNHLILHHAQIAELDDFTELTMDSTAIESDSAFPVDSTLLKKLSRRITILLKDMIMSLPAADQRLLPLTRLLNHVEKVARLDLEISSAKGKSGAKKKRRKTYKHLLNSALAIENRLNNMLQRMDFMEIDYGNYRDFDNVCRDFYDKITTTLERFDEDVSDRGFDEPNNIFSVADKDAAFIKKGGRETTFGYRPTFGISAKGFITAVTLEQGNTSDSKAFEKVLTNHEKNTGVTPCFVSADDGYASTANLDKAVEKGVGLVSFSGAKGKKILGKKLYQSEIMCTARAKRSAVEGTISHLKNVRNLKRFSVCGENRVRKELTIQAIGFNLEKMAHLLIGSAVAEAA